jgi:hypothetical protein
MRAHRHEQKSAEDAALAAKITEAVKAVDTAIATQVERAKAAGLLLHEAHKRHPGRKAFEAFLKLTDGEQYSRAMDLIGVAIDRKSYEKLKADAAARQQKSRDKKKSSPRPEPVLPKPPEPIVRDVTNDDGPEASAERRKAEFAALDAPPIAPTDNEQRPREPDVITLSSKRALAEFKKFWLMMDTTDRQEALAFVTQWKAKAAS